MFRKKSGARITSLALVLAMMLGLFTSGGGMIQAQGTADNDNPLVSVKLSAEDMAVPLDGVTQLQVTGRLKDGSEIDLRHDAKTTIAYSAPIDMFTIGDDGLARAGTQDVGEVQIGVEVVRDGIRLTDTLKLTIKPEPARPFLRDYTGTLTMKLYLGDNGKIELTLDEALEAIKKMDHMTRSMPKIIYLVGWQHDGHDSKYPDWNVVNPKLKRPGDATALDSLKWFMDEAEKYNTTISFHINMTDAYQDSPQWEEFINKDLIRKEENGELIKGGHWVSGQSYKINLTRAWEAGVFQRNIDDLLAKIPQLLRGKTIHIDAFVTSPVEWAPSVGNADPYHKTTYRQESETQKKIMRYWRDKGMDVTSEYFHGYRGDPLFGLQPMAWWADWRSIDSQMKLPAALAVGGKGGNELFGTSMHGEEIVKKDKVRLTGFLQEFSATTLLWQYLNQFERLSYNEPTSTVQFSDGVTSSKQSGKRVVKHGDVTIADGTDMFVPALWRKDKPEIIAFSQDGYKDRSWKLPAGWAGVQAVDVFEIGMGLPRLIERGLPTAGDTVTLSIAPGSAVSITPANQEPLDPIQTIAAGLKSVPAPAKNMTRLTLPQVPEGYEIELLESKRPDVIDHTGHISPTSQEEEVLLIFQVKRKADGVSTHTAAIPVIVPPGSVVNINDVYDAKNAVLTGNAVLRSNGAFMTGSVVGFVGGPVGNNNTVTFQQVNVPGDGLYELQLEYATAVPRSVFVRANEEQGIEVLLTGTDWNKAQLKTIQVVLKKGMNTITLYNPTEYAPDMGSIIVKSITPNSIADWITSIQLPGKNDKYVTLPSVPQGFTVSIKSSDNETVIKPDGRIVRPAADQIVYLILQVTRNYDGVTAETAAIPVVIAGEPQIISVATVVVNTEVGKAPVLPTVVTATYSDMTVEEISVVWDAIEAEQYAKAGTFTVTGAVAGTDLQAIATVHVKESPAQTPYITRISPAFVETVVGTPPAMPTVVTATYSDLSMAQVSVVWDQIDASLYSKTGSFTVNGTVEGTLLKAEAMVTVKADQGSGNGTDNGSGGGSSSSSTSTTVPPQTKEPKKPQPNREQEAPKLMELTYVPTTEQMQHPHYLSVVRVNEDGSTMPVVFSAYDPSALKMKFLGYVDENYKVVYKEVKFTDLQKHVWAKEAIEALTSRGVLDGVSLYRFVPEQAITRAELVVMLVRMLGLTAEADSNFADVNPSASYYYDIAIAKKAGLIQGVTDKEFQPEAKVTREQWMTIIERALRQMKVINESENEDALNTFTDREQIADYALRSAAALVKLKLIVGANQQLLPKKTTSRAEAALVLYRIIPLVLQK
ncbi:S-layer homology domain-containing protein [Paenibacillus sp. chi10]|uniref:S-layer homology domain-containing protein n=1 Tax=Paenibacillus suaedae TaxID=3077233 RepID=A0AAJ2JZA7_9BACL|nr:Ig-like domain-containing protein [Paenibacillus sp. chi10]MDT8977107.1 S-layer homology domain-containing protein [Paenibacillus sp. chi10]